MGLLTYGDVKRQSLQVFGQFGKDRWIPFSRVNSRLERMDDGYFKHIGIGKFLALCAMGESLEDHIETLRLYRDRIDILTCDKGFGYLIDRGIKADYVIICDTNIPFTWLEPYLEYTKDVTLISTPYANLEWTHAWKGPKHFYVNRDAIETEKHFLKDFQDARTVPAGSNVSNAMLVFMTGCDEKNNINYAGYEKYFLVGYDYSWRQKGKYYAGSDPQPKRHYMHSHTLLDFNQDTVFTSANLLFSAKWMTQYCRTFSFPVFNCSGRGLLDIQKSNLHDELSSIKLINSGQEKVREAFFKMKDLYEKTEKAKEEFIKSKEELYHGCRRSG